MNKSDSTNKIKTILKIEESTPHEEDGNIVWKLPNGDLHRRFGPAAINKDGSKEWWLYGLEHREGGPAIEFPNGDKQWWINGELHREDGPARYYKKGVSEYYLHGKRVSFLEFKQLQNKKT